MLRFRLIILCLFLLASLLTYRQCHPAGQEGEEPVYLNWSDTVRYVGKETCKHCHEAEYDSFMQSGMGQSFGRATREKSAAVFRPGTVVYDTLRDFYYHPFWENDTLYFLEYRLRGGDTIHKRVERIDYIIGSGMHTNSHLVSFHGYVYQAPLTFYTQEGRWDLPPGFRTGYEARFDRPILFECMTCHNGLPVLQPGSENKYLEVPLGITCERCHGPGSLHAREMKLGHGVDTSKARDLTIVNPRRLNPAQQMSLCQRCHLQGPTVLVKGHNFDDFRPGKNLGDYMHVFLPEYRKPSGSFIMASHADRLRKSKCFASGRLSCVNCHSPHLSSPQQKIERVQKACLACHPEQSAPHGSRPGGEPEKDTVLCFTCHMPKSPSIDIPHVSITDHYIRVPGREKTEKGPGNPFKRLRCMTEDHPSALLMARGYLRFYEGFNSDPPFLDSAAAYLAKADPGEPLYPETRIHYWYLKGDYQAIRDYTQSFTPTMTDDAHTLYRVSEAWYKAGNLDQAIRWLDKAVYLKPYQLEFRNRLGSLYLFAGKVKKAQEQFEFIVAEQPEFVPALSNLGILKVNLGAFREGVELLEQAIALDPDYDQAYQNLADAWLSRYNKEEALKVINRWLANDPWNETALARRQELGL